jgi:uncharacterized NAD(P)/FAD-binding protein YdhS
MVGSEKRLRIFGHGRSTRVRLVGDWEQRPLEGIREVCGLERALDKVLRDQVRKARDTGCSWTEVGDALGTSKQAAWERFSGDE